MRYYSLISVGLALVFGTGAALAEKRPLDCSKRSLAKAVQKSEDRTIRFTGICEGPIVIRTDNVSLLGMGTAIIDGNGQDAVTVEGANGVSLTNIEVRNGTNGILGLNGAHVSLTDIHVHDNQALGISLQTGSSADLVGVSVVDNGLHGLDMQTGAAATISGTFTSTGNGVFGVNVNGSALTFSQADATMSGNAVGMQVATGANAFLNDPDTVVTLSNNFATGLTIVSGAHMVSFGGSINASGNPVNGISLNSKAGLDLDAGSTVECSGNGDGLQIQQASEMTVFNIPQFSGVPAFSRVNCHDNNGNGIVVRNASSLRVSNQAQVISTGNGAVGLIVDDGSDIILVNSDITDNSGEDIQLSFGSRADLLTSTFSSLSCDATVLVRGSSVITCPQ